MTEHTDQLPWYRHFWPWFVLLLLGSAVTASLSTLYIAMQGNDSLVVDRSEGGTDVITERNLAAQAQAADLGLGASMRIDTDTGAVQVVLTSGTLSERPTTLDLWISHPTFSERDERTTLTIAMPDENGRLTWSGLLLEIPVGRRYVVLSDGNAWRLNGTWEGEPLVRLSAAGPDSDE
ncbi:MAG: FixH family protein [Pseudomonadota bacterium]